MTGRLFRLDPTTGRWAPVGPPLGQAPHLTAEQLPPVGGVVHWTIPIPAGAEPGDRLHLDERLTLLLLDRCGPNHPAWHRLVRHSTAYDPDGAADWLAKHEVWSARRIEPTP